MISQLRQGILHGQGLGLPRVPRNEACEFEIAQRLGQHSLRDTPQTTSQLAVAMGPLLEQVRDLDRPLADEDGGHFGWLVHSGQHSTSTSGATRHPDVASAARSNARAKMLRSTGTRLQQDYPINSGFDTPVRAYDRLRSLSAALEETYINSRAESLA